MSSAVKQMLVAGWRKRWSPELWLLASNLLSRLLGFVVSLLVSRLLGVQSLGMYSGMLITTASPTTPMASALANNATMLAVKTSQASQLPTLLRAHALPLFVSGGLAYGGCLVMMYSVGLHESVALDWMSVAVVAGMLVLGQLLTPFLMGMAHGANLSLGASAVTMGWTVLGLVLVYPVITGVGLLGTLWQAAVVGLLPALTLFAWMVWRSRGAPAAETINSVDAGMQAREHFLKAMPSMGATVANNATNWLACIYLAERAHGAVGVGQVAIGLQWMALMLLPLTSWNGRVMRALALAHSEGASVLKGVLAGQVRRCVLITMLASAVAAAATPWIAELYRVEVAVLWGLMLVNALAAVLFAVNFVYERVCFCLGTQGVWLKMSMAAYVAQLVFTFSFIRESIWVVALGNLLAIGILLILMRWVINRELRIASMLRPEGA